MGSFLFIILFFLIAPGIVYYLIPNKDKTKDKRKLFLQTVWIVHAIGIVPLWLSGIYLSNQLDFWFFKSINDSLISSGKGAPEAIAYGYAYFIFYLSIAIGPLKIADRRLGYKIDRFAYALSVIWFWITMNTLQNFFANLPALARLMFPLNDDNLSQWALIGYIALTTTSSWLVYMHYKEMLAVVSSSKNKNQEHNVDG